MKKISNKPSDRLIIFSRYPIPGQTKTRLISAIGKVGAADLQRRLTEATYMTAQKMASFNSIGVEVRFDGGNEQKMRRWLGSKATFMSQPQGSLGNRMHVAFKDAFKQGCGHVVLIGSDIPGIDADHLTAAFDLLNEYDLVLGPSTDGGYWLVGMKALTDIFQGVNWGTENVFEQTFTIAKKMGLKTCSLDVLPDIDTGDDLKKCDIQEVEKKPYISVIIPTLNEETNIEASIFSAQDEDSEVIVVDGGSSDHTVENAIALGVRVEISRRGRAIQQNMGSECAGGKVLLFLHADTILPSGYVNHVFDAFIDAETAAGAFQFKTDWGRPLMKVAEFLTNLRSKHLGIPYGDQALFIRKSLFEDMGGFPHVPIAEDLFLIRQIACKGHIRIVPAQAVTSARRWKKFGVFRTTLINQLIVAGCYLGISPHLLASLWREKERFGEIKN